MLPWLLVLFGPFFQKFCLAAQTLLFDQTRQLRMRFPLPYRLESTEIIFAFKTETKNAILLSTYSQTAFTEEMQNLGPIQSDGMRVDLLRGYLKIEVALSNQVVVSKIC